ncbi:MAG: RDD family protein [Bacillati bacterium ANGP1]|uniref:RDD family protein n=1 Tax=Candidatus Segetimicrobium genomatis TaxID=2569760 RepID=A0A537K5H4_9BACT|nr:MAG: RDD family protein [Terrabacteria group bacterium ANGP1]
MATECPSCRAALPPGSRFCPLCHTFVSNPNVGRLASPARRLGATLMEWVLLAVALSLAFGAAATGGEGVLLGLLLLVGYGIWAIALFAHGTTPGKRVLGLEVVHETGQPVGFFIMFVREWIGKWISGLIFGLGFLWILIDKDRQAWHDKFVATYVVEKGAMPLIAVARA